MPGRAAQPVIEEGMHDVARAGHVAHQHVEGERPAAHHRRLDPERQAAIEPVALQHLRILVEPPVQPVEREAELGGIMALEAVDLRLGDLRRLRQIEAAMDPVAVVGIEAAADFAKIGRAERGHCSAWGVD